MASELKALFGSVTSLTLTGLNSLANAAGWASARQTNSTSSRGGRRIRVRYNFRTGSVAPTANTMIEVFLVGSDGGSPEHVGTLAAGQALPGSPPAAGITVKPTMPRLIEAIPVTAATATDYAGDVVVDDPGPFFYLVVWNGIGQALDSTLSNFYLEWAPENAEAQ